MSTEEQLHNLRGLKNGWDRQIDQRSLRVFLRHMFNFTTREFLKHIAPILVAKRLARASSAEQKTENLELGLKLKRTRKVKPKEGEEEPPAKTEIKIWFAPLSVAEIDLSTCPPEEDWSKFAAKDGTPYDPTQPVECELLDCILKHGLPEDGLAEAPPPARRKRKADTQKDDEDSPSKKKPTSPQASPNDAAKQRRGRPKKDQSANATTPRSSSKKKKKTKEDQVPTARSPTPPPATFQLPKGLADPKAKARVLDLRDDGEDSASESGDSYEEPDLARAIRLSTAERSLSRDDIPGSSASLADFGATARAVDLCGDENEDGRSESHDSDEDADLARAIHMSLAESSGPSSSMLDSRRTNDYVYGSLAVAAKAASDVAIPMSFTERSLPKSARRVEKLVPPRQAAQPSDAKPAPARVLVPGESISALALRELRAGSSLLAGAAPSGTLQAGPGRETLATTPVRKLPEVIDLT